MMSRSTCRRALALVLAGSCLTMAGGCSWLKEWPPAAAPPPTVKAQPQAKLVQTATSTWLEPAIPANIPVEKLVPEGADTEREAAARIEALEAELASLRNEMKTMVPAVNRLAQSQASIVSTLQDIAPAAGGAQMAARAETATPLTGTPVPMAAPAAMSQGINKGTNGVAAIRFGEQSGKSRIVLDTARPLDFAYDVDNQEKIMMVSLPGAGWNAALQEQVTASSLVTSYNAVPDGQGGTTLYLQLSRAAGVAMAQNLPAVGDRMHRIVIDLRPL